MTFITMKDESRHNLQRTSYKGKENNTMIGLLIFGFILLVGLSIISRPFRGRRRRTGFGYRRGGLFGGPFEERREYGHHHHHQQHHHTWGGDGGGHHGY